MTDSNASLEVQWLRKVSGVSTPASLANLRQLVAPNGQYVYWSGRSGLAPASKYTLADHMLAAMKITVPAATGSLADVSQAFWVSQLP